MKNKLILFTLVLCFLLPWNHLMPQWVYQNIPDNIGDIISMDFTDAFTGSGCGNIVQNDFYGRAVYTTNGGSNWILSQVPDSARLIAYVQFINHLTGYSAGAYNTVSDKPGNHLTEFTKSKYSQAGQLIYEPLKRIVSAEGENYKGMFFKTTNAGQSWNAYGNLPENAFYLGGLFFTDSVIGYVSASLNFFGGVYDGILKTTNGGESWHELQMPSDTINSIQNIFFVNSNTGYAAGYKSYNNLSNGILLKTTNAGSSWTFQRFNNSVSLNDVYFPDPNNGFITGNGDSAIVMKTTNGGDNWSQLQISSQNIALQGVRFVKGTGTGIIFGGDFSSSGSRIYISRTSDYGQTWVRYQNNDSSDFIAGCKLLDENNWYAGGGDAFTQAVVLHSTNGGVNIKQINNFLPRVYNLYQNYPNPFNPITNLEFGIAKLGFVTLKIYDGLGREVQTLVNGNLSPGNYKVDFDGSNFASGIYYYKLEVGNFVETKRMMLLK